MTQPIIIRELTVNLRTGEEPTEAFKVIGAAQDYPTRPTREEAEADLAEARGETDA